MIDIDGPEGESSWASAMSGEVFGTAEQLTGRGRQLFFHHPGDGSIPNRAGLLPGVDIRGDGGYVVAPPSIHPSGAVYRWVRMCPPVEIPDDLMRFLRPPAAPRPPLLGCGSTGNGHRDQYARRALELEIEAVTSAGRGSRNHRLNRAAYSLGGLVASGELAESVVCEELLSAGLRAGLSERECRQTISSGMRAGMARPR